LTEELDLLERANAQERADESKTANSMQNHISRMLQQLAKEEESERLHRQKNVHRSLHPSNQCLEERNNFFSCLESEQDQCTILLKKFEQCARE